MTVFGIAAMAINICLFLSALVLSWELASTLKESKAKFDSAVTISNELYLWIYAEPDRKAYNVVDLYFGLDRMFFNPASVFLRFDALQKAAKNCMIDAIPDDISCVLQQGRMFVFSRHQLLYARQDVEVGDYAPLDDIFDVCCEATVA